MNPEYNISRVAGSSLGVIRSKETKGKIAAARSGRKHSEETKTKIAAGVFGRKHTEQSLTKMREAKKGNKHPLFGKTHTVESKAKMSVAQQGNKNRIGKTHTEETRIKLSESMGTSVKVTDTETGITNIYPSKRQAAKELNTSLDTVRKYIISGNPYKGRYLIEIK